MSAQRIRSVTARAVWDSRGRPTVEAEVQLAGGACGRAIAPAGASRGSGEAAELRDGGERLGGLGVARALAAIGDEIAPALDGLEADDQEAIDRELLALDGTPDKHRLGGNALIAVSLACAHAAADGAGVPLWQHLAGTRPPAWGPPRLPLPEVQIFGGGAHAGQRLDVQDYMVIATGARDYAEALEWTARVYHAAGALLADAGRLRGVADEGGYWPEFASNVQALEFLLRAIERAGLTPGNDIGISLDVAASEFGHNGRYHLAAEGRELDSDGLCELLLAWCGRFPIVSVEDPLAEDDEAGLVKFTRAVAGQMQVVGDDYLVTDAARVAQAAARGACNALLVKPNQAGTLSETRAAFAAARAAGWHGIVSARSGETEDVSIVHLAVGWSAPQLKVGSFARSERMAKWNEGLRIAEQLPAGGRLPPRASFPWP